MEPCSAIILKRVGYAAVLGLLVSGGTYGKSITQSCPGVEVRSVQMSHLPWLGNSAPTPSISVTVPAGHISGDSQAETAPVVTILGPVLGAMDYTDIGIEIRCLDKGVIVTGVITRSASYSGSTNRNEPWQPSMKVDLVLREPQTLVEGRWVMRLTNGASVDHARTPPYEEQTYPIVVTRPVQAGSPLPQ